MHRTKETWGLFRAGAAIFALASAKLAQSIYLDVRDMLPPAPRREEVLVFGLMFFLGTNLVTAVALAMHA
jgi:hypothetical protein